MTTTTDGREQLDRFQHEALIYRGLEGPGGLVAGIVPFLRAGTEAGDPTLVALPGDHLRAVREGLGSAAALVTFVDMEEIGVNPARIIPVWQDFVQREARPGTTPRGVGEPVWDGRSADELSECEHHEALLNVAFADSLPWRLVCPYDADALAPEAIRAAERTHPHLVVEGVRSASPRWSDVAAMAEPNTTALPPAPDDAVRLEFAAPELRRVRRLVRDVAVAAGLAASSADDLALAAHELAANSILHGGGSGVLRTWRHDGTAIAEVSDAGRIDDPLVGRRHPDPERVGGRGVWMAHQLCDLVQVRRTPGGTTIRLHQRRS